MMNNNNLHILKNYKSLRPLLMRNTGEHDYADVLMKMTPHLISFYINTAFKREEIQLGLLIINNKIEINLYTRDYGMKTFHNVIDFYNFIENAHPDLLLFDAVYGWLKPNVDKYSLDMQDIDFMNNYYPHPNVLK